MQFLAVADRTLYGRAYATDLRPSVVCRRRLWRYVLWLNGASWSKSYYWAYRKSHIRNWLVPKWMTSSFCLEVVSRSRQPSRYILRWISQKPLEIEAWLQWSTN